MAAFLLGLTIADIYIYTNVYTGVIEPHVKGETGGGSGEWWSMCLHHGIS